MTDLRIPGPAQPEEVLDGRYRLQELIGEGGMGSVWRAFDDALGRTVAVKVFTTGTAGDTDAVRRESEKRLLASVNHPSLVTLFDAQLSNEGRSYLVMEYIDGGTLADLIAGGTITERDAASLAADMGEALHVVHGVGIIHRDIKPANILLRPPLTPGHTFRAVLADFGIAYLLDAARVTAPGTAIGTAAYISPEQVRGHAPTPASDIYSLGLVLLEALSGKRAFRQQTPIEAISVRLTTPPVIPGDWGYGWRSLLTAMTAIDPEDRPTALEVSARGRELDRGDAGPAVTRAITPDPEETRASESSEAARPPHGGGAAMTTDAPTRVLAHPTTESTVILGTATDAATPTGADRTAGRVPPTKQRRSVIVAASVLVVLVVLVVAGVTIWADAGVSPESPPVLPQLEEPLDSRLQDLLDRVSP